MSKCIAAAALGFILGMKCHECKRSPNFHRLKKQAMKKMGL